VVEGALAVGLDRGHVGSLVAVGVLAHRRGAVPEREGGDEAGRAGEADRRQQARRLGDLRFGGPGAAQERAQALQPRPAEGQNRDRLVVGDRELALWEAGNRRPGAGDAQRLETGVPAGDELARQGMVATEEIAEGLVVLPGRDQAESPGEERQPLPVALWGGDGRLRVERPGTAPGRGLRRSAVGIRERPASTMCTETITRGSFRGED
jgi:hypothetical protein